MDKELAQYINTLLAEKEREVKKEQLAYNEIYRSDKKNIYFAAIYDEDQFCLIKENQVEFFDAKGNKANKKILNLSHDNQNYDKGDYKHYMAKEIDEQPNTIKNCVNEYIDKINKDINIFNFPFKEKEINSISLIGCGTAYHSCLIAKYWFEQLTSLDVSIDICLLYTSPSPRD